MWAAEAATLEIVAARRESGKRLSLIAVCDVVKCRWEDRRRGGRESMTGRSEANVEGMLEGMEGESSEYDILRWSVKLFEGTKEEDNIMLLEGGMVLEDIRVFEGKEEVDDIVIF